MQPDKLHADEEVVANAAKTAEVVATSIDGHRASLQPTVDSVTATGWDGSARQAFDRAYEDWQNGVVSLVGSLRELGGNTALAGQDFARADDAARERINQVQGAGAFDGALRS